MDAGDEEEGVLARFGDEGASVPLSDHTRRLAVVDLEWDRVTATDVFAVLRSFVPRGGELRKVTVYPSDFGLTRLAEEEERGPAAAFATEAVAGEGVGGEALREYERARLRYFYAVAEFDSPSTAGAVYESCDGLEFERSSTRLDLRFVGDETTFEGRPPRDAATTVPPGYAAVEHTSKALQQTRVGLSWDGDDPTRKRNLTRKLTADQLKEEDFAAYLGSGSEGGDGGESGGDGDGGGGDSGGDEGEKQHAHKPDVAALRARLLGDVPPDEAEGRQQQGPVFGRARKAAPGAADMVVTFGVGLSARLQSRADAAAAGEATQRAAPETVWAKHLRERREKKLAAKRTAGEAGADADADAAGFDDPFFGGGGGGGASAAADNDAGAAPTRRRKGARRDGDAGATAANARSAAELELMLLDDAALRAGTLATSNAPAAAPTSAVAPRVSRKQARVAAKAAKLATATRAGPGVNVADPRFSALFTRPEFAIDPTNPRAKEARAAAAAIRAANVDTNK